MESLIEKIKSAFAEAEYPGDDNLTDSFGDEAEALARDFQGKKNWKVLEPRFLNQAPEGWGSALSFFSAKALRFYLPAYLIADIEGTLEIGDATTRLCMFVTPQMENRKIAKFYGGGTFGEHARNEFEQFNPAQVSVIVSYLWWKLEKHGYNPAIEQALENYWLAREAVQSEKSK